ncbi:hypothetical protein GGI25_003958 [Coemansia spiralis]|uniref:Inositol polyphosphate-related phosphatase domain-containing protein n=1 Tax=Coemansia spiralis TaxID=417178 RepID=A0A9W8KW02_9FUNG|nr:hypothetical protein GGI26_004576 [Coemansia sp. RSA 1358]KAJ2675451.1 hypothetical protein GGI25_003958 [Coemansia spiralis]
MHSDEEDSPPKTLAERIARLGLDNETAARPLSRNSISGATNSRSAESIFPPAAQGKPPIAPKPKFGVKPNQESTPRAQHGATPPTNGHMKQDRPIARAQQTVQSLPLNNQSDALGIRSTGQGTEPGRSTDNEAPAISIKDRIRNLRQVQSSTTSLVVDPNTSAICNPFASPELTNEGNAGASDAGADEHQLFPLSPLPPPAQAFDGYAVDSTRSTSLPPLPPPPSQLSSNVQTPLDLHSNGSEALPRPYAKRASRVPLPPPPPPPPALHRPTSMLALKMHDERHTHDAALAADDSHRSLRPRPPPKPTGVANLKSRVMCTRVDTGEMCAIHNAPGPDERFTSIAPVRSADDPFAECARVWACTSTGRIVVLNSFNTGAYQENLQSSSRAAILCMFSSGIGEIWTLHDDGIFEVWRDRSVDGNHDQPLVPIRKFSITNELQMARRMANQKSTLLLYRRELWFASSRCIWVYDTHRYAEPLASVSGSTLLSAPSGQAQSIGTPMMVAQLSLTSHDSSVTCMASNVEYLDESYISIRGFVFSGTDAGHIIVWKASTYERWRTIDMSKGEADVRITSLACVSDRWLWVGYSSGKISIVDIGPDTQSAAVVSCPLKLGYQDNYAVAQRRDSSWIIAKEWAAAESAVLSLHVDWSPLLTERRKLQVASVHSNGSVFYWDGSLAMDCQYNELRCRTLEYVRMRDITVQINSWNIDAIKPDSLEKSNEDKGFLREWLGASGIQQGPEIIVVGLQEVVDLESKKMTAKSLWMNTTSKHKQKGKSGTKPSADISKRYGLWRAALEKKLTREMTYTTPYRTVECQNMVGLFICIFARDDIYRSVREVDVSHVKTGMGGLHGNKGGIGIRLILNDTSFCFINAHLAAGESVRNNAARIEHCTTIVKNVAFSRPKTEYQALSSNGASDQLSASVSAGSGRQSVPPTLDLANVTLDAYVDGGDGQRYLDNAVCFFSGDLNFRLNLSRQQAERYIEANELDSLLQFDQLLPMISPDSHAKSALSGSMGYAALGSADPTLPAPGRLNRINSLSQIQPTIAKDRSAINRSQAQSSQSSSPYSSGEEDEEDIDAVGTSSFALKMFREMPIQFRPTYKYDPGTDRYDTSEKRRTPAWCDRVLYRGGSGRLHVRPSQASDTQPSQLQQIPEKPVDFDIQGQITPLLYRRLECRQSDHRPIVSAFGVKTKAIDRDSRKQVLENIQYRFETQNIPEMVYFAKVLWLSRHTTSMSRAGELLASRKGNLQEAIKALYQQN